MKRTEPRTEPWGTPKVIGDEGELYGGIPVVDVLDERHEANHCRETEEMPNQVERRWSGMVWSRVSKAADRSRRLRQETCCIEMAFERWSCREGSVVLVEYNLL